MSSQSYKKVEGKRDLLYHYFNLEGRTKLTRDKFYSLLHMWFKLEGDFRHSANIENEIINKLKKRYAK